MSEQTVLLGVALVLIGVMLVFAGSLTGSNVKFGFGGFIGPVPFGFANDPRMLWFVLGLSAVMLVLFILR